MSKKNTKIPKILMLFVFIVLLISAAYILISKGEDLSSDLDESSKISISDGSSVPDSSEEIEVPDETVTVHVVAVGDNLIHSSIYKQANARANFDGYDFDLAYENVEELIGSADLAIINQETLVNDKFEPSNFPRFSTPTALGDKMIDMGFDAFSIANNHVWDYGNDGIEASLDYWDSRPEVTVYGGYRNDSDMENIRIREVNGVTFAFLAYTEHYNGNYIPSETSIRVVRLSEEALIERQIKKADELADVVIVSPHFGTEVVNYVTTQQKELSAKFIEWGADVVLGTQPHTIQTMERIKRSDGTYGFVYYCLGNFISAMNDPLSMVGMLAEFEVEKNLTTGEVTIGNYKAIPLITHYDYGYTAVRVYPFYDYTEQLANSHGIKRIATFDMAFVKKIISENIPEEYLG